MKLSWRLFLGGPVMFWLTIILFIFLFVVFIFTYFIDATALAHIKPQGIDTSSISEISEEYVKNLGVVINKPIEYKFVHFKYNDKSEDEILLGTFHEWNETYYIDISADLYKMDSLKEIVIHETRHMLVEFLNDEDIIDLTRYTEEIAKEENNYYNNLFNSGIYLWKKENGND